MTFGNNDGPTKNPNRKGPSLGTQTSYGAGQIAGQLLRDVPSLLLLFFMTNVLGIPAAVAGTAIFAPKLLVGVSGDLIVGAVADRWKKKLPFYNWLLICAFAAPLAMFLLFNIPDADQSIQIIYIVAILSFYMLVLAAFSVPYLAIAASLANTPHQRTVLMAWRLFFTAVGLLVAGGLAPAFIAEWGGGTKAYSLMSICLAALCFFTMLIAYLGSKRAFLKREGGAAIAETKIDIRQMLLAVKVPQFSVLLCVSILQFAGAGMSYASMLYFLKDVMALDNPFNAIAGITFAIIIGIMVAQPFWVRIAKLVGKKRGFVLASFFHAAAIILWALMANSISMNVALFFAFLVGIGNSGWAMLGFSMMSDIAGKGRSGLYSSVWIAADKIGLALGGTLLVGITLSLFGFDSVAATSGLTQSPKAIQGIMVTFGLLPGFLYTISGVLFHFFGSVEPEN